MASFIIMFIGGGLLTFFFNPEFLGDNPVLRASGNNNVCVLIDSSPATYLAAVAWPVSLIFYTCYAGTMILEIKHFGTFKDRAKLQVFLIIVGLLLWCCFGLAIVIKPRPDDTRTVEIDESYSLRSHQIGFLLGWMGYCLMIFVALRAFKQSSLIDGGGVHVGPLKGAWDAKENKFYWVFVAWLIIASVAIPSLLRQIFSLDYPGYYNDPNFVKGAPNPFGIKSAYKTGGIPPIAETIWTIINFAFPFIVWLMNPVEAHLSVALQKTGGENLGYRRLDST